MWEILSDYWPHLVAVVSLAMATAATIHAVMTKDEVRAAIGWTAVIVLSPIIGALLYGIAGINRIRRAAILSQRPGHRTGDDSAFHISQDEVTSLFGQRFAALKTLGDRVARHPLTRGNTIRTLHTGDEAYAAMLEAIGTAQRSVLLETYIFDRDPVGLRIADALIAARARGVAVRVLIDAVGARYSVPSIAGYLREGGIDVRVFNGNIIVGLRLPYANLRTHRKIIVVDGAVAFMGGMNIRQGFTAEFAGDGASHDTHFQVTGPVVADLFAIAAEDWRFTAGEALEDEAWDIPPPPEADSPVLMRAVPSGPDSCLENNHKLLIGALSVARRSVRIMSPYFLPDQELISALMTAARRGVSIDIVVPAVNNLVLVDRAMTAQFDQMLKNYCRIWRSTGPFDHSKLFAIDGAWAYVGSSNLDPRSLRLNFEIDVEVLDHGFSGGIEARIDAAIETAEPVTLAALRARPYPIRLIDRLIWLGSPYL
ncbi:MULTISPECIES: phospholipase D-like domain-containing protein [unclassified Bosea (in: a-proteobacteria)]|uniref:phospholipase D-like domain-containing protein n=1 Tax=unclassified Bosea (in: a-proteobacteria) TaxID=2653178 RepID=UPI000956FA2E|nr:MULTISPECIES: phospholipase D-like domain-containing protein [unclassified Bosea (in: a-proteobacteria)]TAJ30189.1 MAG: cardiolipin synthase [Bosea sp. (in: a-proteobacteria)]SIP92307.1 cardiolipin synthase [Bosea sp. TND4EK4]